MEKNLHGKYSSYEIYKFKKKKKFIKYIIKLKTKLNGQKIKTYKKKNIKEKNFVFMKR